LHAPRSFGEVGVIGYLFPKEITMAKEARKLVTLECSVCKNRGYHTEKRLKGQDVIKRLEFMKYCSACKKKTEHKETK